MAAKKIISFSASIAEITYLEAISKRHGCSLSQAMRHCIAQCQTAQDTADQLNTLEKRITQSINSLPEKFAAVLS